MTLLILGKTGTELHMLLNRISLFLVFALLGVPMLHAQPVSTQHLEAELVAEHRAIQAGQPFWVALRLKMEDGWHTYWKNHGESGIPTRFTWDLPEGFTAGDLQWPYPIRFNQGDIISFGYKGEVFLLTEITPPDVLAEDAVLLQGRADWLLCLEICIPGRADLSLYLPVSTEERIPRSTWASAFQETRMAFPEPLPAEWQANAHWEDQQIRVTLTPTAASALPNSTVFFFAEEKAVVDYTTTELMPQNERLEALLTPSRFARGPLERLRAVVVAEHGWQTATGPRAYHIDVPIQGEHP